MSVECYINHSTSVIAKKKMPPGTKPLSVTRKAFVLQYHVVRAFESAIKSLNVKWSQCLNQRRKFGNCDHSHESC